MTECPIPKKLADKKEVFQFDSRIGFLHFRFFPLLLVLPGGFSFKLILSMIMLLLDIAVDMAFLLTPSHHHPQSGLF